MGRGSGPVLDDYVTWQSGGTPSKANQRYWAGNIPWITPKDMKWFDLETTTDYLTPAGVAAGSKVAPQSVTYIVVRGMILAHTFPVSQMSTPAAFNQDVKAVAPGPELIPRYLAYWFQAHAGDFLRLVGESTHGTKKLDLPDLRIFPMDPPALAEQAKIVEILTAVDDQIRIGNEMVSKLNLLSSGVADRLLYEGVDSADLPAGWRFSTVGEVYEVQAGITLGPHRAPRRNSNGYLRVANVQRSAVDLGDVARLHASPVEQARYRLATGDLLVVEGHADINQIGRCARVPEEAAGLVYQNHLFRLRSTQMNQVVGEAWLNSRFARQYWRRTCSSSSGLNTINSRQLRAMRVIVPPPEEQGRIAATLLGMAERIEHERETLDKLVLQKAGLIADLLTGRVRVPVGVAS